MNKELKLLLITLGLILVSILVFWYQQQGCYQVEYQDVDGSHYTTVCEQVGE